MCMSMYWGKTHKVQERVLARLEKSYARSNEA